MKNKWNKKTFKKFIIDNRPELKLLSNFTKYHSKVDLQDIDGNIFSIMASEIILGKGVCGFRTSKDKNKLFIFLANKKHEFKYDYSKIIYKSSRIKLTITCHEHGDFEQKPASHLQGQGCPKCGKKMDFEIFVSRSKIIHNNKYYYLKEDYSGVKNIVKIICPNHGLFNQIGSSHLNGRGCKKCAAELNGGYKKEDWERISKNSKLFESYKVYIINLYNDNENFIKIGRTFTTLEKRLKNIPYSYNIIKIFSGNIQEIYNLEIELHKKFKNECYKPNIKFRGMTECFTKNILKNELL